MAATQDKTKQFGQIVNVDDLFDWAYVSSLAKEIGYDEFWIGVRHVPGKG
jgi:hypothetical protein